MNRYKVLYSKEAVRAFKKTDGSISRRIKDCCDSLISDPEVKGKRLSGHNLWSLRIGDYRIIYEIDFSNKVVYIITFGHRKKIYFNLQT